MSTPRGAATLGLPGRPLVRRLIEAIHDTPLGASSRPQSDELASDGDMLAAGRAEYEDGPHFFGLLGGAIAPHQLRDREVLDLGCGYGGRTVWYERHGAPRSVTGLEIDERMVERCRAL